jgi:hypothetical protein
MRRQYGRRRTEDWDGNGGSDIVADGQGIHVRCDVADASRAVRAYLADTDAEHQRRQIADAVARDARIFSGHRPGPCSDAFSPALTMDGAYSTAFAMRDQALADLCKRSQNAWRKRFADQPASLNAMPPPGPDQPDYDDPDEDDNGNGYDLEDLRRARDVAYASQYRSMRDQPWNASNNLSGVNNGMLDPEKAAVVEKIRRATVLR